MKKSFDIGKDVYCWCLLDESNLKYLVIPEEGDFYTMHFKGIEECAPHIKKFYVKESMKIHSPGSFLWYDMKNIYNHIGEIFDDISLDDELLKNVGVTRYFCELYIWRFLKPENIQEQTIINNMKKQFSDMRNNAYTQSKQAFKSQAFGGVKAVQNFGVKAGGGLDYEVGDRVRHMKFGDGLVTNITVHSKKQSMRHKTATQSQFLLTLTLVQAV